MSYDTKKINKKIEKYFKYAKDGSCSEGCVCCTNGVCGNPCKCCSQWINKNLEDYNIEKIIRWNERKFGFEIFMEDFTKPNVEDVDG